MSRPSRVIFFAALLVGVAALSYFAAQRLSVRQIAGVDDLAWLKREFRLADQEMQRIRQLHEGYLPKCREMCGLIADKRNEVDAALSASTNSRAVTEQKLVELATLRAQCQARMLGHFEEVSRAMPAAQGQRYLREMQKLTLGFHHQFEHSMGNAPEPGHGHGHH